MNALTGAFGCYRLELPEGTWVDVIVAANAAQEAEEALAAGDLDEAKAAAMSAVSLVRQPFLPGEDGSWVEAKRHEFADIRSRALSALAEASLGSGDASEAAKWAEQMIALEPFRETGYRRRWRRISPPAIVRRRSGHTSGAAGSSPRGGTYPSPETESIYRGLLDTPSPAPRAPPRRESDAILARRETRGRTAVGFRSRRRAALLIATAAVVVVASAIAVPVVALTRAEGAGGLTRPPRLGRRDRCEVGIDSWRTFR